MSIYKTPLVSSDVDEVREGDTLVFATTETTSLYTDKVKRITACFFIMENGCRVGKYKTKFHLVK